MKQELIDIVIDTHWLSHCVVRHGAAIVREVIEVRMGEWRFDAMAYLEAEGSRLAREGFEFTASPQLAEQWARFEFRRIKKEIS